MARTPVTQPFLDAFTTSVSKALAIARVARRDAQALRVVAPSANARVAIEAVDELLAAAENAAVATALLGRQERAAQAQLYPTSGREVLALPAGGPPTRTHAPA